MAIDYSDIFGNKAREEIDRLKREFSLKLSNLTKEKEVQEKSYKAYIASINASGKSKEEHDSLAVECEDKKKRLKTEIESHETRLYILKQQVAELDKKFAELAENIAKDEKLHKTLGVGIQELTSQKNELTTQINDSETIHQQLTQDIQRLQNVQEILTNGNACLYETISQINRHSEPEKAFSMLEYDLIQFVEEDRKSGAMQFNLDMKPLCLVVDVGMNSTALALVRVMKSDKHEIICNLEAQGMCAWAGNQASNQLRDWVKSKFILSYPNHGNPDRIKPQFHQLAQRLLTLLILNTPYGEIEESVTLDSQQLHLVLPFTREEITPLFMPVTGPSSDLPKTIKVFLKNKKVNAADLDRIVSLGSYSRLPLLQDSLKEVFGRQVVQANSHIIIGKN